MESNGGVPAAEQTAISEEDKSAKPEQDIDLLKALEPFIKYVRWENKDADYFLKNVHGHKMMTEENENAAMASMLQSFIDNQPLVSLLKDMVLLISNHSLSYIHHNLLNLL